MPDVSGRLITRDHARQLLPVLELNAEDRRRVLALDYPVPFAVFAGLLGGMGISYELLINRMGGSP